MSHRRSVRPVLQCTVPVPVPYPYRTSLTRVKVLGFLHKIQVEYGGVPVVPKPIYRFLYGNPIENGVKNTKSPSH